MLVRSRDCSVLKAIGCGLGERGVGVGVPVRSKILCTLFTPELWAHSASFTIVIAAISLGQIGFA
jgi:hypothetical protein